MNGNFILLFINGKKSGEIISRYKNGKIVFYDKYSSPKPKMDEWWEVSIVKEFSKFMIVKGRKINKCFMSQCPREGKKCDLCKLTICTNHTYYITNRGVCLGCNMRIDDHIPSLEGLYIRNEYDIDLFLNFFPDFLESLRSLLFHNLRIHCFGYFHFHQNGEYCGQFTEFEYDKYNKRKTSHCNYCNEKLTVEYKLKDSYYKYESNDSWGTRADLHSFEVDVKSILNVGKLKREFNYYPFRTEADTDELGNNLFGRWYVAYLNAIPLEYNEKSLAFQIYDLHKSNLKKWDWK